MNDIVVSPNKIESIIYKLLRKICFGKNQYSILMYKLGAKRANKLIDDSECDLIFVPGCSDLIYLGQKSLRNKKLIYLSDATYHRLNGYYFEHSIHDQKIGNNWEKKSHELSSSIILPSTWAAEDTIEYYKTPDNIINILKFGANLQDFGYKYFEPGKEVYKLLLVGVDYVRKGVDIAIETVKILNESSPDVRFELSIVGLNNPGVEVPDYVTFYGRLRKDCKEELEKLVDCYINHDIFILPTKAECSAIVFSEAAMFAMPTFTYLTGGTLDYVEDGVSGRCFALTCRGKEFAEAITDALESGEMEKYSYNARRKYEEELNWEVWLKHFEDIALN